MVDGRGRAGLRGPRLLPAGRRRRALLAPGPGLLLGLVVAAVGPAAAPGLRARSASRGEGGTYTGDAHVSRKYLIASFPEKKQVAYCHLPDNVWRPLVIGTEVSQPAALSADANTNRLFVADPPNNRILWYSLFVRENGFLWTEGPARIAVQGYTPKWLAVNGVSDLYFTGAPAQEGAEAEGAVYRVNAESILAGDATSVHQVWTRFNSGAPHPAVWNPSGIAVDSFDIFWGNQEQGTTNGAVVKGDRLNVQKSSNIEVTILSKGVEQVLGIASTSNYIYYLAPEGVYGVAKDVGTPYYSASDGLICPPPGREQNGTADVNELPKWDPASIIFDKMSTMYLTDQGMGKVYSVPAMDLNAHHMSVFSHAPGAFGITMLEYTGHVAGETDPYILSGMGTGEGTNNGGVNSVTARAGAARPAAPGGGAAAAAVLAAVGAAMALEGGRR